jgi:soluble lytic murein transglycosylase-like protein
MEKNLDVFNRNVKITMGIKMIKYILTIFFFTMSVYIPTIASVEGWDLYDTYKKQYKWLTYSIVVTADYNARLNDIRLDKVLALIHSESEGDRRAVSKAGARGLMQIMPCHWKGDLDLLFGIYLNIKLGTSYYKWCLDYAKGNEREALRFYNAGPFSNAKTYGNYKKYVDVILENSLITQNFKKSEVIIR